MTAFVFVDTNVLVYARDPRDPGKRALANEWIRLLWNDERGRTSYQVLNEYYDVVTRKLKTPIKRDDAWDDLQFYLAWNPQPIDLEVLMGAHEIQQRHQLSWWDCLVVSAAQAQDCVLLLSEDLQDGADYGGIVVRSPFTLRVAEEAGAYSLPPRPVSRHRGRGRPRTRARHAGTPVG
ncbi:MAG: PIN domain-containing protein [Pseudomonadota bacterium]